LPERSSVQIISRGPTYIIFSSKTFYSHCAVKYHFCCFLVTANVTQHPPYHPRTTIHHHHHHPKAKTHLSVRLGNTLQLILLLDSIAVAASLGSVNQLLSQALGNGLDVPEGSFTGTDGEEGDGLVDAAEGRYVDGLSADGTGGTDSGGVFAGAAVDDGVDGNLEGVGVGGDVDLEGEWC